MKKIIIFYLLVVNATCLSLAGSYHWYKGNTHCHTIMSDGKNTPADVIAAYHAHGYNFLAITDHNLLLKTDTVKKPSPMRKDFLLIPGEEASDRVAVHTTAFGISKYVPISTDTRISNNTASNTNERNSGVKGKHVLTVTEMIQLHVDGTLLAGGIPFINHPNFSKGIQVSDMNLKKCLIEINIGATEKEVTQSQGIPRIDKDGKEGFSIEFIGHGGKILSIIEGAKAVYHPKKGDRYVRARITRCVKTNRGYEKLFAWAQPVFMY